MEPRTTSKFYNKTLLLHNLDKKYANTLARGAPNSNTLTELETMQ